MNPTPSGAPEAGQRESGGHSIAREAYWREVWEAYRTALCREFPALLDRVLAGVRCDSRPGEVVLWQVYNAGWVLRAAGSVVGMDLALLDELAVDDQHRLEFFGSLDLLLVSHQHADHCCASDLRVLAELGEPPVACHPDTAEKLYRGGVPEKQVVELEVGQAVTVAGVRVRALPAEHFQAQIPHCIAPAFEVDDVTVVHAGDNRLFEPPALRGAEGCDILIHCIYAYDETQAREGELTWSSQLLEAQARFLAKLSPRAVLLAHVAEVRHPYEKLWRYMHAGLLKERLFSLAPEVECPILGPGERYVYR